MNTDSPKSGNNRVTPEVIAKLLTSATNRLDVRTVEALRRARHIALERQARKEPVLAMTTGNGVHWLIPHSTHQWVAVVILLVTLIFGGITYTHHAHEHDIGHLDAQILTDDLPLEVFVD